MYKLMHDKLKPLSLAIARYFETIFVNVLYVMYMHRIILNNDHLI